MSNEDAGFVKNGSIQTVSQLLRMRTLTTTDTKNVPIVSVKENRAEYHRLWLCMAWSKLIYWFGGQCWHCGSKLNLEFAHFIPTGLSGKGRGKRRRLYDILNHPLNYGLLCTTCHMEFDGRQRREHDEDDDDEDNELD